MTAPLIQASPAPPPSASRIRTQLTARRWGLLLAAGWLGQAALRIWFSLGQAVPLANPDEAAYLITARVLAGGPAVNLSGGTLYPAGYPLLISPVFWITHNPVTAYNAVLVVNALFSALLMPLAYVAGRRLGLDRPAAYAVAAVTGLLPAGFFYSQYALTDAIYPVIMLAWLLATHSWLTASSMRSRWAAAIGSALLAGYCDAVHSRGLVIVGCYLVFCGYVFMRRLVPRDTVVAAALALGVTAFVSWAVNLHLAQALYPNGARSLSGQARQRLGSVHGVVSVLEMAAGQLWRFTLDGWGVAAVGLVAAVAVVVRSKITAELRLMAVLAIAVTAIIAVTAPAALPANQPQAWASGRYLDGMIATFFVAGAAVLLRADRRQVLGCAAAVIPPAIVAAVAVDAYAGASVPTDGFSAAFNFAEPAVLTQNWMRANVALATAVALGLLAIWVMTVIALPARARSAVLAGLAAVSIAATAQMTITVSRASTPIQQASLISGPAPHEQIAISRSLNWVVWVPQAYEIWWTHLALFSPRREQPPSGVTVVEVPWSGKTAQASWPQAPAGWHVARSSSADGWVVWRYAPLRLWIPGIAHTGAKRPRKECRFRRFRLPKLACWRGRSRRVAGDGRLPRAWDRTGTGAS
jgi:hypothetical protein